MSLVAVFSGILVTADPVIFTDEHLILSLM